MAPKKKGKEGYKEPVAPKAPGFQLPEPDRQLQLSSPPLLPPELEGEEDHLDMASLQPRKIQLQHLTLLTHPVTGKQWGITEHLLDSRWFLNTLQLKAQQDGHGWALSWLMIEYDKSEKSWVIWFCLAFLSGSNQCHRQLPDPRGVQTVDYLGGKARFRRGETETEHRLCPQGQRTHWV